VVFLKTREALYRETSEIMRVMSVYKTLKYNQIIRVFPEKIDVVKSIISRMIKEKRIFYNKESDTLSYDSNAGESPNNGLITAFWVLIDFFDGVEYHSPSEYPAQIAFFMNSELYEIIYAEYGKENIVSYALSPKNRNKTNRIVVIDEEKQITKINAENIFCFCVVNVDGGVEYYNLE
jgi:hypothetical protein